MCITNVAVGSTTILACAFKCIETVYNTVTLYVTKLFAELIQNPKCISNLHFLGYVQKGEKWNPQESDKKRHTRDRLKHTNDAR